MKLVPFSPTDCDFLIDAISSEELAYQWGGGILSYPLTVEQLQSHTMKPDIFAFIADFQQTQVGYIELRRQSAQRYRICRVFIAERFRRQGLAKQMVQLAMDKAEKEFACRELSLSVFQHNHRAYQCYLSLGFSPIEVSEGDEEICGRLWTAIEMEKALYSSNLNRHNSLDCC